MEFLDKKDERILRERISINNAKKIVSEAMKKAKLEKGEIYIEGFKRHFKEQTLEFIGEELEQLGYSPQQAQEVIALSKRRYSPGINYDIKPKTSEGPKLQAGKYVTSEWKDYHFPKHYSKPRPYGFSRENQGEEISEIVEFSERDYRGDLIKKTFEIRYEDGTTETKSSLTPEEIKNKITKRSKMNTSIYGW